MMNQAMLVGEIVNDPEKITNLKQPLLKLRVKTWKDVPAYNGRDGFRKDSYHNIDVWGNAAKEAAGKVAKGYVVAIGGSIETRKVGEGQAAKYFTAISATSVQVVSGGNVSQAAPEQPQQPAQQWGDDDIPF